MRMLFIIVAGMLLAGVPARGQKTAAVPYQIDFDPQQNVAQRDEYEGKTALFLEVRFGITLKGADLDETSDNPAKNYKLRIEENGKFVKSVLGDH